MSATQRRTPAVDEALRLFVDDLGEQALILLDAEGRVTDWNAGAARLEGRAAEEVLGLPFSSLLPHEEAEAAARDLEEAVSAGRSQRRAWRTRGDGGRYLGDLTTTPLHRDEQLVGYGLLIRDVTAEVAAHEALRRSEEQFRLLATSVRDYAIFMLDPAGHVASWNQGAQAIKGYTAAEVLGRHFSVFYPREVAASGFCERELEMALAAGRFEDEGWRVRKDGTRFWANVVITAVRNEAGQHLGFAKVTRDLTGRKRAEEELRQSEERFRLLIQAVRDYAIFMLDPAGRVTSWNQGAQAIKGYTPEEILGRHFSVFYPPEVAASGLCEHELEVATRTGRFEAEGWRVRKDGTRFWANVVLTALFSQAGEHLGFSKVTRDLTAQRRAEETRVELARAEAREREKAELVGRLEELNARLNEAVRARDDFLTVASHELRTPIHTLGLQISTGLWLLDVGGQVPLDKIRGRIAGAQAQVQRLTRLLNDLLDVSRIAASRLALEPRDLELVALARQLLERDKEAIARSGSTVTLEAPPELRGRWDELRLDQVLTNLLSNAVKYGEGKPITLRLEQEGELARIIVRDEGMGIDQAAQARIFERFERAVSSRGHSGFGLGLWIVRQVLEAMGGRIRVESAPGEGSTFTAELPLRPAGT